MPMLCFMSGPPSLLQLTPPLPSADNYNASWVSHPFEPEFFAAIEWIFQLKLKPVIDLLACMVKLMGKLAIISKYSPTRSLYFDKLVSVLLKLNHEIRVKVLSKLRFRMQLDRIRIEKHAMGIMLH
jgi:hypothetical protein